MSDDHALARLFLGQIRTEIAAHSMNKIADQAAVAFRDGRLTVEEKDTLQREFAHRCARLFPWTVRRAR